MTDPLAPSPDGNATLNTPPPCEIVVAMKQQTGSDDGQALAMTATETGPAPESSLHHQQTSTSPDDDMNEEAYENESGSDGDDDTNSLSKERQATNVTHRMDDVHRAYVEKKLSRRNGKTKNADEPEPKVDTRSTKWLVQQSASHRIISQPREYQTELFEKAKKENIIAVLDTGKPTTLRYRI